MRKCNSCKQKLINPFKYQKVCKECRLVTIRKCNRKTAERWRKRHSEKAILKSREWVKNNYARRLEIMMKYERKKGKIPREEWIKKISGKNHKWWRGGTTQNYPYQKEEWKELIVRVWKRDKFECQRCSVRLAKGVIPQTHHIKPRRLGGPDSMKNLITFCKPCHAKVEWETLSLRGRQSWLALV